MRLRDKLRALLDPRGPIGEFLSPADVFKERAGLPIEAPKTARAHFEARPSFIQQTLAPARFVPLDEARPPKGGVRQVSPYVQERWVAVHATSDSDDIAAIITASRTVMGYKVTQHEYTAWCDCKGASFEVVGGKLTHKECGRAAKRMGEHAEDFAEHVQSLQFAPQDQYLNGFYETIPGSDSVMTSRGIAKGGTRITGGRAEYNRKTAGMMHWDAGTMEKRAQAEKQEASNRQAAIRKASEVILKKMPRKMSDTK